MRNVRLARVLTIAVMAVAWASACASSADDSATTDATTTTARRSADGFAPLAPPTSRPGDTTTTSTTSPRPPCTNPTTGQGDTVAIRATDFRFDPACVSMTAAQGINVTNAGSVVHNVTLVVVSEAEVEYLGNDLQPGQNTATEAFGNQGPGANTYRLFCRYHEAQGMEAFLVVSD